MEDLFSVKLNVNNEMVAYRVVFDHEAYHFLSEGCQPSFSFKRTHDEWQGQNVMSADLKLQAVDALEGYLLRQH